MVSSPRARRAWLRPDRRTDVCPCAFVLSSTLFPSIRRSRVAKPTDEIAILIEGYDIMAGEACRARGLRSTRRLTRWAPPLAGSCQAKTGVFSTQRSRASSTSTRIRPAFTPMFGPAPTRTLSAFACQHCRRATCPFASGRSRGRFLSARCLRSTRLVMVLANSADPGSTVALTGENGVGSERQQR